MGQSPPSEIGGTLSSGDAVTKNDYRGKYLLVVYWSLQDNDYSQCDKVLREIREQHMRNKDFMMLNICTDGDFKQWMEYLDKADKLEKNGETFAIFRDQTWWHAHVFDYSPHPDLGAPKQGAVAHLLGPDGKFLAVRIPVSELRKTVQSKLAVAP